MVDPEKGFTSSIIKDPKRFVGRSDLLRTVIRAINNPLGLIAVYGKRGVGKSSLLRQLQQIALGDYKLIEQAGLRSEIPKHPRKYLTVYYQCDSMISNATDLLSRLCNDQDVEDGLLRLVPNDGKEIIEFTRASELSTGVDLKVVDWGAKGIETSKFAKVVPGDGAQTFRNFINAVVVHQVKKKMNRDGLLIILDEFDVIEDKRGLGSLIKSLSSENVKFAICGIGKDITDLVVDHASVERLLEQGAINVKPMPMAETVGIIHKAEELFAGTLSFDADVSAEIANTSQGYPYFTQMLGKLCVEKANLVKAKIVDMNIFKQVLLDIKSGKALPTLEDAYQRAIGESEDRQMLLHLLAEQPEGEAKFDVSVGQVFLKKIRGDAEGLDIKNLDQNLPRLLDNRYGPVLTKATDKYGAYEFNNPVLRLYIKMRTF